MEKKLSVAMLGQKRLSREGGVEIVVKELCTRMAKAGHKVTCYNRSGHHVSGAEYDRETEYTGIRQRSVPTIEKKGATKNAAYVNNGINMKELQEIVNQTEKVAHPFTVFTLGRICYQKNPTLFNTIAELLPDVRFVWIGDGELREELKSKNIEISGWVDRTTAIKYAVNADVFLLPSRWEGLPISLLESMYMRKVCVVSNVIGNRDVIHNGENGFVCSNTEEFVKAIKEAQNGADGFTERAYQDVLNMYNTKAMAKQYSEKYDKAINTPRGGYSMS